MTSDRKVVFADLMMIYRAEHQSVAKDAFWRWENRWQDKYPQEAASVREELGHLLAFYICEPLHWEYVRTSNPIERVFRELRRQQFGCWAFANRDACNQVVFRALNWLNEICKDNNIWQLRLRKRKSQNQFTHSRRSNRA